MPGTAPSRILRQRQYSGTGTKPWVYCWCQSRWYEASDYVFFTKHLTPPLVLGHGNCDGAVNGANGQPIKVPCSCPPSQADFDNVCPHALALAIDIILTFQPTGSRGKRGCWSRYKQPVCPFLLSYR